jgi:hypothetical protein
MSIATLSPSTTESVIRDCVDALRRVAIYTLPPPVDQRLKWLAEHKSSLTEGEREELLALAEFAEQRTLEKVQARAILKRLSELLPELAPQTRFDASP